MPAPQMTISAVSFMRSEFGSQFFPAGFNQYRSVWEDDGGNAPVPPVDLHDEFGGFGIAFQPDLQIGDLVRFKKSFSPQTIWAILGSIHYNLGGV